MYPSENGLTVFYFDITEKRKTEEELQKLSIIVRETDKAFSLIEPDGKISWVNDAFTRMTGYTFDEAVGNTHSNLLNGPDTDPATIKLMKENFEKGLRFKGECLRYTKNKRKIWISAVGQPIINAKGEIQRHFLMQTDITERKQFEFAIQLQQKKTTAAVIAAEEKARAQVGLELHDNVNQVLTTIKLYLELCTSGSDNSEELIQKCSSLLKQTITEVRNLSHHLSAPTLGNISFTESVKDLVGNVSATDKIHIHLDISGFEEENDVNQELHLAVYRILQEHLTNILNHAEASIVNIALQKCDSRLSLVVTDNGKGFDTNNRNAGVGITNMKSRTENLNGTLKLLSSPGYGCELHTDFPLN